MNKEELLEAIQSAKDEDLIDIMKVIESRQKDIDKLRLVAEIQKIVKDSSGERRFVIGYLDSERSPFTRKGTLFANGKASLDDRNYEYGNYQSIEALVDTVKNNGFGDNTIYMEYIGNKE